MVGTLETPKKGEIWGRGNRKVELGIREGLRFLEEREVKLNVLRRALIKGEESGFVEYSLEGLFKDLDKEGAS